MLSFSRARPAHKTEVRDIDDFDIIGFAHRCPGDLAMFDQKYLTVRLAEPMGSLVGEAGMTTGVVMEAVFEISQLHHKGGSMTILLIGRQEFVKVLRFNHT